MRNSFDWLRPSYEQTEEHPVVCVSINDALEYTKWLSLETGHSYRLPYEAEWDFAFYSGSKYAAGFKLPGGGEYNPSPVLKDVLSDSRQIDECALGNFGTQPSDLAGCYGPHRYSVPVGSYSPNRVGIYDMFGNVQEITLTCAFTRSGDGKRLDADNPSGDVPFQRVPGCAEIGVKGGGFYLGFTHWLEVKPRSWTGDYGEYYYARNSSAGVGFRVVRDLMIARLVKSVRGSALSSAGWYGENSGSRPHPVGKNSPTRWGCTTSLGTCGSGRRIGMVTTFIFGQHISMPRRRARGPSRGLAMNRIVKALLNVAVVASLIVLEAQALAQSRGHVASSLLLLIDASGSMGNEIGSGTPHVKIEVAKQAAVTALGRAAKSGTVEVAVLAFSGDCQNPVPRYQDFTRDVDQLTRFIGSLQPGGGTPMADALRFANRYMASQGNAGASNRMIMLLADGQNDCGDIGQAMASLQASGLIFRHETVGFGITPTSQAAQDLRDIATQTGGTYHHAVDATQLADVFMEFVDTFSVIDLLGRFGSNAQAPPSGSPSQKTGHQPPANTGGLTSMLGSFEAPSPAPGGKKAPPPKPPLHGALAIDANQGPSWGWAIDYPTTQAAERRALDECGGTCRIVMRFSHECGAFAADQAQGSTSYGWANGYDTGAGARNQAIAECRKKGGTSCIVRAWGCTQR